jgi:hypothetical protein
LLAAAHGGQIPLTQAVQQLARGALPEGAELRNRGEHHLRDLLELERIFQLLHLELQDGDGARLSPVAVPILCRLPCYGIGVAMSMNMIPGSPTG